MVLFSTQTAVHLLLPHPVYSLGPKNVAILRDGVPPACCSSRPRDCPPPTPKPLGGEASGPGCLCACLLGSSPGPLGCRSLSAPGALGSPQPTGKSSFLSPWATTSDRPQHRNCPWVGTSQPGCPPWLRCGRGEAHAPLCGGGGVTPGPH